MLMKSLIISASLLSTLALAESSTMSSAMEKAQTKLYDLVDKDITTVNFEKGRNQLSEAEVRNIRATYKSVLADTSVSKVIVAAWSDLKGVTSNATQPADQVELAQKRAEAVKRILVDMGGKNVETYNMGQDASWIEKTFHTKDAKMKEAVREKNVQHDVKVQSVADTLESKGGPGKAVVIVQRQEAHATTGR